MGTKGVIVGLGIMGMIFGGIIVSVAKSTSIYGIFTSKDTKKKIQKNQGWIDALLWVSYMPVTIK